MTRNQLLWGSLFTVLVFAACKKGSPTGPTAAPGTNLSGTWTSNVLSARTQGGDVSYRLRFRVDASSTTASSFSFVSSSGEGLEYTAVNASAPITDGRLRLDQSAEGSCNDVRNRLMLDLAFRSATQADGRYEVSNPGAGTRACGGSFSGDITFTKQ